MPLEQSQTNWPLSYNDDGLLIGPLRMRRLDPLISSSIWVYCWNDPGVRERVREEVDAVVDYEQPRYDR